MGQKSQDLIFPSGFLWGTATSAHQVEGDNIRNDWWEAEKTLFDGRFAEKSEKACDHYHLYKRDFDLAVSMSNNAHRLSIEWSRIEPVPGRWDKEQINYYKKVLQNLKQRGIKPVLTLHHFTNPLWFSELGSWENKHAPYYFARFVQFVVENLGDLVTLWITVNEPVVYAGQSYFIGAWPPGKRSIFATRRVLINLVRAHKLSYRIIHQVIDKPFKKAQVGIAQNVVFFAAEPNSLANRICAKIADRFYNFWFFKKTPGYHDFIGLNYYMRLKITQPTLDPHRAFLDSKKAGYEVSDLGWEIYPEGLRKLLLRFSRFRLPIYITENGIATDDEEKRIRYLVWHLLAIHQAISKGADIRGYFHWSLLDNFEWAYGFSPHFGLFKVDRKTQKRTQKPSASVFGQIARENRLFGNLLE